MDFEYLKYKINTSGLTKRDITAKMGISTNSLYQRLVGKVEWNCKDMRKVKEILNLNDEEFKKIFGF